MTHPWLNLLPVIKLRRTRKEGGAGVKPRESKCVNEIFQGGVWRQPPACCARRLRPLRVSPVNWIISASEAFACTCTIALGSGCVSSSVMATKLNPLNSWWALALGGTPGESGSHRETAVNTAMRFSSAQCEGQEEEVEWQPVPLGVLAVNSGSK